MPQRNIPETLLDKVLKDGVLVRGGRSGNAKKRDDWMAWTRGSNPVVAAAIEEDDVPAKVVAIFAPPSTKSLFLSKNRDGFFENVSENC